MGPQSFRIQREGTRGVRIVAGDSMGAMYGALELAEQIGLEDSALDDAVRDIASERAASVNNEGVAGQIESLGTELGAAEAERTLASVGTEYGSGHKEPQGA